MTTARLVKFAQALRLAAISVAIFAALGAGAEPRPEDAVDLTDSTASRVSTTYAGAWTTGPGTAFNNSTSNADSSKRICVAAKDFDITYTFDEPTVVNAYGIQNYAKSGQASNVTRAPKAWTLSGVREDGTVDLLDDTHDSETGWDHGEYRYFTFSNATAYKKYTIAFKDNNGDTYTQFARMEFFYAPPEGIAVGGSPGPYGEPDPGYGTKADVEIGQTYDFTSPTDGVDDEHGVAWHCTGWTFESKDGTISMGGTIANPGTDVARVTFEKPGTLTWLFDCLYKVSFVCDGGDVDTNALWYAFGETVTVTFAPDEGRAFFRWESVPAGADAKANPLVFKVTGPCEISCVAGRTLDVPSQYATIAAALEASEDGDTVRLAAGEYEEAVSVTTAVAVVGAGVDRTVFTGSGTTLKIANAEAAMSGFTVSNAVVSTYGGNLVAVTAGWLTDFKITDCGASLAKARFLDVNGEDAFVSHGVITRCGTSNVNLPPDANVAIDKGTLENMLIYSSNAGSGKGLCPYGGGLHVTGAATVRNCTVAKNKAATMGGGLCFTSTNARFVNCIFAGNVSTSTKDTSAAKPEVTYCNASHNVLAFTAAASNCFVNCAFGSGVGPIGEGGVSVAETDFKDWNGDDFRAKSSSPVVDAGSEYEPVAATDLAGEGRVLDAAIDIGCYEFAAGDLPGCSFSVSDAEAEGLVPVTAHPVAKVTGGAGKTLTYRWTAKNESMEEADVIKTDFAPAFEFATPGKRTLTLEVFDGNALFASCVLSNAVNAATSVKYLAAEDDATAQPAYPYSTPQTAAKTNLVAFLEDAVDGQEIRLKAGTIDNGGKATIGKGVKIVGAGVDRTIITGRDFSLELVNAAAEARSFTISNAVVSSYDGAIASVKAGRLTNFKITDSTTSANHVKPLMVDGASAFVSHGIITKCGGGNSNYEYHGVTVAKGTLENSLVSYIGNGNGVCTYGGGIYVSDAAVVRNCTFVKNKAAKQGGGLYLLGNTSARLSNCVFAGNLLGAKADDTSAAMPEVTYVNSSSVQPISAAVSNCFANCAFGSGVGPIGEGGVAVSEADFKNWEKDNFIPSRTSAAVDAGAAYEPMATADLAGKRRVVCGTVDIGCYENQQFGTLLMVR